MRQAGEGKRVAIGTAPSRQLPLIILSISPHGRTQPRQDRFGRTEVLPRPASLSGITPQHNQHPPGGPLRGGADRRPTAGPPLGTPLITVPSGIANARPTRQGSGTKPCRGGRIPPHTVRPYPGHGAGIRGCDAHPFIRARLNGPASCIKKSIYPHISLTKPDCCINRRRLGSIRRRRSMS